MHIQSHALQTKTFNKLDINIIKLTFYIPWRDIMLLSSLRISCYYKGHVCTYDEVHLDMANTARELYVYTKGTTNFVVYSNSCNNEN